VSTAARAASGTELAFFSPEHIVTAARTRQRHRTGGVGPHSGGPQAQSFDDAFMKRSIMIMLSTISSLPGS
jgi:hypothetical protein